MAEFNLTCFGQSGNAYKAALALNLAHADWAPVFIDFMNGAHRSPEFMEKNEMARVPVLEHGGKTFSESGLILDVIARETGKLGGETQDETDEIRRWILWDNYAFTSTVAPLRFLANFVPEDKRPAGVIPFLQGRLRPCLKVLDKRLGEHGFVACGRPTIADCSVAGYMFYGDELPFDLGEFHHITEWMNRLRAMDGFVPPYELMPLKA